MGQGKTRGRNTYEMRDIAERADRYIQERGGLHFDFDRYRATVGAQRADPASPRPIADAPLQIHAPRPRLPSRGRGVVQPESSESS